MFFNLKALLVVLTATSIVMARVIGPKHGVHDTHANGSNNSSPDDTGSDTGVSAGVGLQLGPGPVDLNPVTSIAGQATQDLDNTAGAIVDKLPLGLL